MASAFPLKQLLRIFWQINKPHSCWLLLILWVSSIAYSYVVNVRNRVDKQFATRTKTMQKLTALNIKLLKTVTVNVLETRQFSKSSYEMANVVNDSGEGQHFLLQAGARKQLKMLSWSHWQARWVWRLFYIMLLQCIRNFHWEQGVSLCTIMPHYVTKLGEKNYWRKLRSVRVFSKNCASNFFWSVGKGVASEM